jgi:hypothetical protein
MRGNFPYDLMKFLPSIKFPLYLFPLFRRILSLFRPRSWHAYRDCFTTSLPFMCCACHLNLIDLRLVRVPRTLPWFACMGGGSPEPKISHFILLLERSTATPQLHASVLSVFATLACCCQSRVSRQDVRCPFLGPVSSSSTDVPSARAFKVSSNP